MTTLTRERLERLRDDLRGLNASEVARRCQEAAGDVRGITRGNITAIRDGKTENPGIYTVEIIEAAVAAMLAEGEPAPQEVAS